VKRSTRRELIGTAAVGAAGLAAPPAFGRRVLSSRAGVGPGNFVDGVASGDPTAHALTFWSRLSTQRPRSGARLIVARDEGMRHVVATRVVPTGTAINGTLKKRVGRLRPYTEYFYVWESGNDVSDIGRTRTLPDPLSTQPLNIGFSSCQSYAQGYYSPHVHAAGEDLDLYVFLGDYIYAEGNPQRPGEPRADVWNAHDLRSYRAKYKLYRSDLGLRSLHQVHPTVHIWDDHEVENDYTDNHPAPSPLQRTSAYRVALEWLPRWVDRRDRFKIYKRIPIGRTADLFLLDERQYRTVDENNKPFRLLGDQQLAWLINGLQSSQATWKIVANQVLIAPIDYGTGPLVDTWGGYEATRAQVLGALERAGIDNVVFITGDAHVFMVNRLISNEESLRSNPNQPATAIEYMGGSVTSAGPQRTEAQVQARNPFNVEFNSYFHGYAHMALDPANLVTEYRASDITQQYGGTFAFERFTQPAGANEVSREQLRG
jgi:phosphodiesterase/alkaline phosphatase D-like protein